MLSFAGPGVRTFGPSVPTPPGPVIHVVLVLALSRLPLDGNELWLVADIPGGGKYEPGTEVTDKFGL